MKTVMSIIAVLITFSVTLAHAVVYTGAMDNRTGYLFVPGFTAQARAWVTGDAAGGGLRLEWQVDNETTPGSWTYTYRLLRGVERNKGFAFFDIETAADFLAPNILSRQVLSATDRFGAPITPGLASITISDPVNFNAVHDFSNAAVTEASPVTALNKSELSHYSGDSGRVAPGVPGSPASATPSVGPVPHHFYGIRVTFPDDPSINLAFLACEWEFRVVADRAPMWGKVFGWADQTTQSPFFYTNFYNDSIDNPGRLALAPANSLTGAGPYRGWVLVPGSLPGVTSTNPADATGGVPVTEPVSAVFSGLMDSSTITPGTFTLTSISGPVSGAVHYDPLSKIATFQPNFPLTPNTTYTATIAAGVKDLAGNALSLPKIWSFTTSTPDTTAPSVTATLPDNGAAYVATTSTFKATFSEAIDPATLTPASFSVAGVSGTVGYDAATRTATFTPSAPLANNSTYTANLGSGIKDLAGNPLATPVQWSVTTIPQETVLPIVVSTVPAARAVNVVTTTTISATFSEAIDPATITPSTFFVTGLSGTTVYDSASRTATFTPAAALAGNTNYALTVTTGVRDLAGNPVGLTKGFSFKTLNTLSPNFSASGTVTGPGGSPLAGVSLLFSPISQSGTAKQTVVTDASGHYHADQLLNGSYIIVPSLSGSLFSPQSTLTSVTNASVSGLDFIGAPLTITTDKASPQPAGTPITLTASVQGGSGTYEYRFWLNSGTGYTIVQDYSAAGTFIWTPTANGNYDILVDVRNAGSTAVREASTKLFFYQIQPAAATGVSVTPSLSSPGAPGTPITFTAAGQGGSGAYEYRFWLNSGTGYTIVQAYSAASTLLWTPAATGNYDILVDVRNAGSTAFREASTKLFFYQIQPAAATGVSVTPSLASPQAPGTPITFTAAGQGGGGAYEYQFWINSGSGYNIVQVYSAANTFVWTPAATGNYDILVDVRNAGSTAFREALTKIFFYQVQ
jgi:Bacterial Ig-like domain